MLTVKTSTGGSSDFHAGSGIGFHVGASARLDSLDLRATIGFLNSGESYDNGGVSLNRYPVDISSHFFFGKGTLSPGELSEHAVGTGAVYHMSPKLSVELKGVADGEVEFDSALGYFIEYLWVTHGKTNTDKNFGMFAGLRYTFMNYHLSTNNLEHDFNANHLGFNLGFSF